jgi:Protein of unknown function (DUF992)
MTRIFIAATAFIIATATSIAHARDTVRVGVLTCVIGGGSGYILGSMKPLYCDFNGSDGRRERYRGSMRKYGIDIGTTSATYLKWIVFAPTSTLRRGALSGSYGGATVEATVGAGLGANALVGGSERSISLQPFSAQAQVGGANIALGAAAMTLRYVR